MHCGQPAHQAEKLIRDWKDFPWSSASVEQARFEKPVIPEFSNSRGVTLKTFFHALHERLIVVYQLDGEFHTVRSRGTSSYDLKNSSPS
jgi:hypothetical protein